MSSRLINLTGKSFGRLTVVRRDGFVMRGSKQPTWLCQCECGNSSIVVGSALRSGNTKSCGCLFKELIASGEASRKHGMTGTPEHHSWRGMIERCTNEQNSHYANYGGRGIGVCERWKDFSLFFEDMGKRPAGTTLDRIDTNGDYSPDNCRWATCSEQSRNTTRSVVIEWNGISKNQCDWAHELGITPRALAIRIKRWGVDKAMTTPKRGAEHRKDSA